MTDLVKRLRAAHANSTQRILGSNIFEDAASALESLSAENAALKQLHFEADDKRCHWQNEAERLLQQRNEAFERAAAWHEEQADLEISSLHCGDGQLTITAARRRAAWHVECAKSLRNLSKES